MGIDSREPEPQETVWKRLNRLLDERQLLEGSVREAPYVFPECTVSLSYRICRINERTVQIDSTIRGQLGDEQESIQLYEDETEEIRCGKFSTHEPEQIANHATVICCHAVGSKCPPCCG